MAWGYVDQPPLTVALVWLARHLFGDSLYGLRLFPALAYAATVALAGLTARELGGRRFAQTLAALLLGVSPFLIIGHMAGPTVYDLVGWAVVMLLGAAHPADRRPAPVAPRRPRRRRVALRQAHHPVPRHRAARRASSWTAAGRCWRSPYLWAAAAIAIVLWVAQPAVAGGQRVADAGDERRAAREALRRGVHGHVRHPAVRAPGGVGGAGVARRPVGAAARAAAPPLPPLRLGVPAAVRRHHAGDGRPAVLPGAAVHRAARRGVGHHGRRGRGVTPVLLRGAAGRSLPRLDVALPGGRVHVGRSSSRPSSCRSRCRCCRRAGWRRSRCRRSTTTWARRSAGRTSRRPWPGLPMASRRRSGPGPSS